MARGSKPGERRGGRAKGTPNKLTGSLREAILGALEAAGGQAYLEKLAKSDPRTFCALLGKILPTQLEATTDQPLVPILNLSIARPSDWAEPKPTNELCASRQRLRRNTLGGELI